MLSLLFNNHSLLLLRYGKRNYPNPQTDCKKTDHLLPWDLSSNMISHSFKGNNSEYWEAYHAAFSQDSNNPQDIIVAGDIVEIKKKDAIRRSWGSVWDLCNTTKPKITSKTSLNINTFLPYNDNIIVGFDDGTIKKYDLTHKTGKTIRYPSPETCNQIPIDAFKKWKNYVVFLEENSIKIFNPLSSQLISTIQIPHYHKYDDDTYAPSHDTGPECIETNQDNIIAAGSSGISVYTQNNTERSVYDSSS